MQLEAIGRVSVGDLGLEIGGQVDDVDGVERAFLWADTATDAQALRDEGDLGLGGDFDAQLARADYGTRFLAFLPTFLVSISARTRGAGISHSPSACTTITNILTLAMPNFVWRGSAGYLVRVDNSDTVICQSGCACLG